MIFIKPISINSPIHRKLALLFNQRVTITIATTGGNLLSRLQHTFSPTSDYTLQFYYDTYTRNEAIYKESRDTLDLDFQHRFALLDWHEIVWGTGLPVWS